MRPYSGKISRESAPKRIFNYRLSKARRIVENAFGILAARWRIYHRTIQMHPKYLNALIQATCALHNYLMISKARTNDNEEEAIELEDMGLLTPLKRTGIHASQSALKVRDTFCKYFNSPEGAVPWQEAVIRRGCCDKN